jgi:hypothetical protein
MARKIITRKQLSSRLSSGYRLTETIRSKGRIVVNLVTPAGKMQTRTVEEHAARCLDCDSQFADVGRARAHYRDSGHRTWSIPSSWTEGHEFSLPAVLGEE